jgi:hypothetical protein
VTQFEVLDKLRALVYSSYDAGWKWAEALQSGQSPIAMDKRTVRAETAEAKTLKLQNEMEALLEKLIPE